MLLESLKNFCVTGSDVARLPLPQIISPLGQAALLVNPLSMATTSDRLTVALRKSIEQTKTSPSSANFVEWFAEEENFKTYCRNSLAEVVVGWENIPVTGDNGEAVPAPFDKNLVPELLKVLGDEAVGSLVQQAEDLKTFYANKVKELEKKSVAGPNTILGTPGKNTTLKPTSRAARRNPISPSGILNTKNTKKK